MPRKHKTATSPFAKACAVALSLVLVVTMCPIVGFAEDSSRADVSATEEVQAGLLDANDSHVDVPDDALSVSSNISLDGTSKDDTGSIAGGDASVSDDEVSDEDASDGLVVSSADTDAAEGAEDDQPATEASTEPGPNPFKGGVDAQNLAALDNYECGNYPELDKSLMWKTSASCSGKKMWMGTLVQDNGYWNEPGWNFECGWEAPNPLHDAEIYAYLDKGFTNTVDGQTRDVVKLYGDGGLTSMDIAAVLDGSYDVYIPQAAFNYHHLKSVTFPSFVKEIEERAFSSGSAGDLTSVVFETSPDGSGIECLHDAFTDCAGLSSQELIVLPSSLKYLYSAFYSCGAVKLRIDNPDVRLARDSVYDEGHIYAPCDEGSTVYAYKKRTDGTESDPWKLSQLEEGKGINWVWLDDDVNTVKVTGTLDLPEGVAATDVKVFVQQGDSTYQANVADDGAFTAEGLKPAIETLITITMSGYYDKELLRPAGQMTGDWDAGTITGFSKLAVQRVYPISLRCKTGSNDADGNPEYAPVSNWNSLSFTLKRNGAELRSGENLTGEGATDDYLVQRGQLILSESLANDPAALAELSLEVTPAKSLALSRATATYNKEAGEFAAVLPRWGSSTISLNPAFEGTSRVLVFDGTADNSRCILDGYASVYWPDGQENPTWHFDTGKLKAGDYTIVAFKPSLNVSAAQLGVIKRLALPYASGDIRIEDEATRELALNVPDFKAEDALASIGVKSVTAKMSQSSVVVGCEAIFQISYEFDRSMDATLTFDIPQKDYSSALAALSTGETLECTSRKGALSVKIPSGATSGVISIALTPKKERVYSMPFSLTVGENTVPAGNLSFASLGMSVEVPSGYVGQKGNTATVHAKPGATVQLSVNGQNVGESVTTNSKGKATVGFDLPEGLADSLLYGDRVKVDATATTEGATLSSYADCTYRPQAQIWSLKVTNDGRTQNLIADGKVSGKYLTVYHQWARESCAYWTFDVTVKNGESDINADNILWMYACMQNGRTVAIPLTKKSSSEGYIRFVGEYVDEAYLQLLADNPNTGLFSHVKLDAEELFIPQTYAFNNFALAYASNVDDDGFKERIKKRAEQEAKDRYLYLENLFGDTSSSGSELGETYKGINASLQALEDEIKQRVKEGTLTEAEAQASLAEIEALHADISLDSLRAPIDADDTWIAAIDDPYFTGEDPDIGEYSIPTDAEIDGWYAGQDDATIKEVKDFFHRMKESIDNNYACGKLTNRSIRNSLDAMGTSAGVGKVSASGSPSALMDNCLQDKLGGVINVSEGDSAKGVQVQTLEDGRRLEAELHVTDSQKNGADGKTEGVYTGYSCLVTESAPEGATDPNAKKQNTYKVDFSEHKEKDDHMRSAKVDALKAAGLDGFGMGIDMVSGVIDEGAKSVLDNVLARRILKDVPPERITPMVKAWAKSQMWAKETEEVANEISKCTRANQFLGGLGVIGSGVGLRFAMDSWLDNMDALGVLEADIESINQWILYYKKRNPCDGACQNCLKALYAERDAAEKYRELMENEDDHNYTDVMTGYWNTVGSTIILVATMGSSSVVTEGASTAGGVVSKASLAIDAGSTSIHLLRAHYLDKAKNAYEQATAYRKSVCKEVPKKNNGSDDVRNIIDWDKFYGIGSNVIIDPSGIVYEALDSNPVEGAKATIYVADDANGRNARKWNAEDYEQEGTLTTGADGAFQWDTPTGFYQVRVVKDGYAEARTDWLSVLPIRTGLKVGLKSTQAPSVVAANACPEYIELEFSQYMKADEGAGTSALVDGESARLEWVDSKDASEADGGGALAKVLRIYPKESLSEGASVSVKLNGAKSYTGRSLGDLFGSWSKTLTVEKRPAQLVANYENAVVLQSDAPEPVQVVAYVRYSDGTPVANQPVTAQVDAPSIAALDGISALDASGEGIATGMTDSEGKTSFSLYGDLPGMTALTLAATGTSLSKELAIRTTSDAAQPVRPTATIGTNTFDALAPKENSVTVPKGSKLTLTTTTEGATIYYTTDDTCPCDANGTRRVYTGPISVTGDTKYRIAAYKEGMPFDEYSERLNLAVSVTDDGRDPSGGGEQGGGDNGGTNQGNSGSMNGGQGNNGGSDAPEASGGNQEINSGQTDNANSVTDTDKPASSLGFLAETSDSLGLPVRIALILFCASAIGLASLLLYVGRRRFNSRG
ncbi:MAG: chitobiase/beta-hexosaminidase C-terminal domain-containing protein [Adlercreutzia equolifaciens]